MYFILTGGAGPGVHSDAETELRPGRVDRAVVDRHLGEQRQSHRTNFRRMFPAIATRNAAANHVRVADRFNLQ
jgi:hypothetical protein